MDRRQRKTREAIFKAFTELLSKKDFNNITVGEIIERADVGRATFYAHFETKDYLLKELSSELFCHIFDAEYGEHNHKHIFDCDVTDSVFLHLLKHLQKNDNQILELLSGENNGLFLYYFKTGLLDLVKNQLDGLKKEKHNRLPDELLINHIASTFVETVKWWADNQCAQSPEIITEYFISLI